MSLFGRQSSKPVQPSTRPALECLESRTYFAAAPIDINVTVPGPVPAGVLAGVKTHDKISVNVANESETKGHGKILITLFASTDQTLSNDDAQLVAKGEGLNLSAGANHSFAIPVKSYPQNLAGSYFILAKVSGTPVNLALGSSVTAGTIEQANIDLAGSVTKTPSTGHLGKKISISVQITNDGNIPAIKKDLNVSFGASATPDGASPFALGTIAKPIHLKPGQSKVIKYSIPLALNVPVGNDYIVVDVDPTNALLDPNLANNVVVGQSPVSIT
jgi:hypothetical protein